jgi:hypothetical protein
MEKHVQLVGILNIVYRALVLFGAFLLYALAVWFAPLIEILVRHGEISPRDIPFDLLQIVPLILLIIATLMLLVSVLGIIGGVGVLKKREWARVLLLVISFFNLIRIPLGTILGVYSIWVLLNSETIKLFEPAVPAGSGA